MEEHRKRTRKQDERSIIPRESRTDGGGSCKAAAVIPTGSGLGQEGVVCVGWRDDGFPVAQETRAASEESIKGTRSGGFQTPTVTTATLPQLPPASGSGPGTPEQPAGGLLLGGPGEGLLGLVLPSVPPSQGLGQSCGWPVACWALGPFQVFYMFGRESDYVRDLEWIGSSQPSQLETHLILCMFLGSVIILILNLGSQRQPRWF